MDDLERLRLRALAERFVGKSEEELAHDPEWLNLTRDHHFNRALECARRMVDVPGVSQQEVSTVLFNLLDSRDELEGGD